MKITKIKKVGRTPVYDISVDEVEHYVLSNGVVTHNTGPFYAANSIFIVGRQQEKTGTDVTGYNFIINVEKSRFIKEKSKLPMTVTFEHGINRFSGLLEHAMEFGLVTNPTKGWYAKAGEDRKYRLKDINREDFWKDILANDAFVKSVEEKYKLSEKNILTNDSVDDTIDEIINQDEE